jgi:FkbM family methyltransferase
VYKTPGRQRFIYRSFFCESMNGPLHTLGLVLKTQGFSKIFPITYHLIRWYTAKALGKTYYKRKIFDKYMLLRTSDNGISRSLALMGRRELEHHFILRRVLHPTDNVLDLGANIGYYVLLEHSIIGDSGKIYAVEPDPNNFSQLKRNVALNKMDNVILHQAAVSDTAGKTKLFLSEFSNVHSLIAGHEHATDRFVEVDMINIATFLQKHPIDLIRMDIEGYETKILASIAKNAKQLPKILFETHPGKYGVDNNIVPIFRELAKRGYVCEFAASANQNHAKNLKEFGLVPIKKIATDGFYRYMYKDIELATLAKVIQHTRTVLLVPKGMPAKSAVRKKTTKRVVKKSKFTTKKVSIKKSASNRRSRK